MGIPVTASFVAYVDLSAFTAKPVGAASGAVRPRSSSGCSRRTRTSTVSSRPGLVVMRELPDARLVIVGKGDAEATWSTISSPSFRTTSSTSSSCRRSWSPRRWTLRRSSAPVPLRRARPRRDRGVRARPRHRREPRRAASRTPPATRRRRSSSRPRTSTGLQRHSCRRPLRPRARGAARRRNAQERYSMWRTTPAEYAAHVRSLVDATLRELGRGPGRAAPRADRLGRRAGRRPLRASRSCSRRPPRGGRLLRPRARPYVVLRSAGPPSARARSSSCVAGRASSTRSSSTAGLPFRVLPARAALPTGSRDRRVALHRLLRPPGHVAASARSPVGRRRDARRLANVLPATAAPGFASSSRLSRTGPRATRSATRTRCARSLRTRPSWPAGRPACRRSSRSRRTSISGAFTGRPPAPLPGAADASLRRHARAVEGGHGARRRVGGRRRARARGAARRSSGAELSSDVVDRLRDDYPGRVEHVEEAAAAGRRRAHGRRNVPRRSPRAPRASAG